MAKSTEVARNAALEALQKLRQQDALPLCAETRSEVRRDMDVDLSNGTLFKALQSLHYKYKQIVLVRTGSSEGGIARGWQVDLIGTNI